MSLGNRHLYLAIALALLVSHVGVAVHAATHVTGDSVDCELCVPQGNSPAIATGDTEHSIRPIQNAFTRAALPCLARERQRIAYQQRAPPLSD